MYGLEPSEARKLLANIEGLKGCIAEYDLWAKEVEKCSQKW